MHSMHQVFFATGNGQPTNDAGCSFKQNATTQNWHMNINVNQCGIQPESNDSYIIYPLEIINSAGNSSADDLIYRIAPSTKAQLECLYNRRLNLTDGGWEVKSESTIIETLMDASAATTAFHDNFNLTLADAALEALIQQNRGIDLGDEITFTIESDLANNFTYRINDCWATPDDNITNHKFFDLSEDGCATEDWISINQTHITFDLFGFYGSNEFYIHCGILMCLGNDPSCHQQNCSASGRKRRATTLAVDKLDDGKKQSVLTQKVIIAPESYDQGHLVRTAQGTEIIVQDRRDAENLGEVIAVIQSSSAAMISYTILLSVIATFC